MDQLHEQKFTSLLVDVSLDVVRTRLHFYVRLIVRAWLLTCSNTFSFHLSFAHFLITLPIHFNILHPIIVHLS
jgi:hypothetical protein